MKLLVTTLSLAVLGPLTAALPRGAEPAHPNTQQATTPITLGVAYVRSPTGLRFLDGAGEAAATCGAGQFVLDSIPYDDENDGVEQLSTTIAQARVAAILGPTESGVFTRARRLRAPAEQVSVPVISSQVTAEVEQDAESWFFRLNVDVGERARAMMRVLRKRMIASITVLYEDTEFGRQAEAKFRTELGAATDGYRAHPFANVTEATAAVRQVVNERPEAVGIFAERGFIRSVTQALQSENPRGIRYDPMVFTVLDLRFVAEQFPDDIFFVAATRQDRDTVSISPDDDVVDDVKGMSYDAACLVMRIMRDMPGRPLDRAAFRRRLAGILDSGDAVDGPYTRMNFAGFENVAHPDVYHLADGELVRIPTDEVVPLLAKARIKVGLVHARFGLRPVFIAIVMAAIAIAITYADVRRWYGMRMKRVVLSRWFLLLVSVNVTLVIGIYGYLGFTDAIQFDSVLAALVIAVAPTAIIRTTWLETPAGKAIGLKGGYERLLQWINDKLMVHSYRGRQRFINVLMYHNSLRFLRQRLEHLYEHARGDERTDLLKKQLDDRIEQEQTPEDKLRVCAERLLRRYTWAELIDQGCVPPQYSDEKQLVDPEILIREGVDFLRERGVRSGALDGYVQNQLVGASEATVKHYEDKMEGVELERSTLNMQLSFLHMALAHGVDERALETIVTEIASMQAPRARRDIAPVARISRDAPKLGELLVTSDVLDRVSLQTALDRQRAEPGRRLGDYLLELGYCTDEQLEAAISRQAEEAAHN